MNEHNAIHELPEVAEQPPKKLFASLKHSIIGLFKGGEKIVTDQKSVITDILELKLVGLIGQKDEFDRLKVFQATIKESGQSELTAQQEETCIALLISFKQNRACCKIIEKLLLSPNLGEPDLVCGLSYYMAASYLENAYANGNGATKEGLPEFMYQFAKAHKDTFIKISPTPIMQTSYAVQMDTLHYLQYSVARMIEDELGKEVGKHMSAHSRLIEVIADQIRHNTDLYYSLPLEIAHIFKSKEYLGDANSPRIYTRILDFFWSPAENIPLQDYFDFAFDQLVGDENIDKETIESGLFDFIHSFRVFKKMDVTSHYSEEWRYYAEQFSSLLLTRNPQPFIDQFFTTVEQIDEDLQHEAYQQLYKRLGEIIINGF
ncbi:hypothetical protein KA012_01890, partial [Candidatus Woesebacteria bacterium]|nr:hypothetical protein [Candidatus Woesebacteria bacterium]